MIKTGKLGRLAIWLAKYFTGYDLDLLVSTNIAYSIKMKTLWATAFRVWNEFGKTPTGAPRDEQEWIDLQNALYQIKPESVRQSETAPLDPR